MMNKEEINLLKIKLYLEYYKNDITERYARCTHNIVLDNKVLDAMDEKLYITTLDNHIKLQQEIQELKKHLELPETYDLKTLEDYKSYYEDTTKEKILEDTYIDYCAYVNLAHRYSELKKQLEEKENIACSWKDNCLENAGKIEKLENQQKEFIKWLESMLDNDRDIFSVVGVKDVLSKYKKIIGVKYDNK